jgi:hypothetical protein
LAEEDSLWLRNLRVAWEHEPEPDFVPPASLSQYLLRYPNGVREATEKAVNQMGIVLPDSGLDSLAKEIVQMWVDFAALGLEDVIELFNFYRSMHPGGCESEHFEEYIRMRAAACVPVVLWDGPPGQRTS